MSDPARAIEATDFNARLFDATMKSWQEPQTASGASGHRRRKTRVVPTSGFRRRLGAEPFYETLKESYLLASEYLLDEAEKTDGEETPEQRRLKFHLKQFVDAMARSTIC